MTTAHTKRGCVREQFPIPVQMPSTVLAKQFQGHVEPDGADASVIATLFGDHPVVRESRARGLHWSRIVPACVYWDGVNMCLNGARMFPK